jgi:hypothetical protein
VISILLGEVPGTRTRSLSDGPEKYTDEKGNEPNSKTRQ